MTEPAERRPWRCFVAVPLPDGLREELRSWVTEVRGKGALEADWRWADPESWHVTLAFLGATQPEAVPLVLAHLEKDLAERRAFSVRADGFGAFPGRSHARVLWYGIRDEERELAELARLVRAATATDEEEPFRPHVTLARARHRQYTPLPVMPVESLPVGDVPVTGVGLMRSHVGEGPARYESLGEVALLTGATIGAPA